MIKIEKNNIKIKQITKLYNKYKENIHVIEELSPIPKEIKIKNHFSDSQQFLQYLINENKKLEEDINNMKDFYDIDSMGKILPRFVCEFIEDMKYEFNIDFQPKKIEKINSNDTNNSDYFQEIISKFKKELKGKSNKIKNEAYYLDIDRNLINIIAWTKHGLFNGLQTLFQLISLINNQIKINYLDKQNNTRSYNDKSFLCIPNLTIFDFPDMEIRSISDDHSRGQVPTVDSVKKFIKILSRFKLNMYMFYWEDVFRFDSYPIIGAKRGAWTKEEIAEVDKYAKEHFVELVPIFNSLGHMETYYWNPKLREYAEFPGSACLNVANPESRKFLSKLYKEIAPAFSSTAFHIGADETRDVGRYGSKSLVEKQGLGKTYLNHYTFCIKELEKLGKDRIFLYHDIASKYEEVLENLPQKHAIFVFWDYSFRDKYKKINDIVAHNLPFVVSSSALNWSRIFPEIKNSIRTNKRLIEVGIKNNALGEINSSWGDNGNESLRENRIYPFAASSSMAWNLEGFNHETFTKTFFSITLGLYSSQMEKLWKNMELLFEKMTIPKDEQEGPDPFDDFFPHFWRHPFARYEHGGELDLAGGSYSENYKEEAKQYLKETLELISIVKRQINLKDTTWQANYDNEKSTNEKIDKGNNENERDEHHKQKRILSLNKGYLRYLEYSIRATLLLINKIQMTKKIERLMLKNNLNLKEAKEIIIPVLNEFKELKKMYKELWIACARLPRLPEILRYFDWMIYWLEEKMEQIKNGITYKSPMLLGDWITHNEEGNKTDEPRYFKFSFDLSPEEFQKVKKLIVQFIPGSFGICWINDKEIGRFPWNEESTQLPLDLRCFYNNVVNPNEYLKIGNNEIMFQIQIWPKGWAILHALIYIEYEIENKIESDKENTKYKIIATDLNWKSSISKNGPWKRIKGLGRPPEFGAEIYMPNFLKNWPSFPILRNFKGLINTIASNDIAEPITDFFLKVWQMSKPFL